MFQAGQIVNVSMCSGTYPVTLIDKLKNLYPEEYGECTDGDWLGKREDGSQYFVSFDRETGEWTN